MTPARYPLSEHDSDQLPPVRNVLMVTGRADFGGGPEHIFQLAGAIAHCTAVHFACPRDEPYWGRYQSIAGRDRMIEIPHRRLSLGAFIRLVRFIRERKIDVVHAHGRSGGIFARPAAFLAGVRCFYTPNGSTPVTGVKTFLCAAVEYALSIITRGVVAVSGTEAEALQPLCAGRSRLQVIRNGVAIPPPSSPPAPDSRLGSPLRIVHFTRFVFQKNSHLLIDIIASVRNMGNLGSFEFLVLGDGPGRSDFQAALADRSLDDCVKVLGAVSNPGAYLDRAFCLVSTSRWEGLPLALLEGMARGVPVIATNVTGNRDAVADCETGFLYEPSAPHFAAERLVELAHDPVLWKRMAGAARRRAEEEFSVQAMADATLRLYTRSNAPRKTTGRVGASLPSANFTVPDIAQ